MATGLLPRACAAGSGGGKREILGTDNCSVVALQDHREPDSCQARDGRGRMTTGLEERPDTVATRMGLRFTAGQCTAGIRNLGATSLTRGSLCSESRCWRRSLPSCCHPLLDWPTHRAQPPTNVWPGQPHCHRTHIATHHASNATAAGSLLVHRQKPPVPLAARHTRLRRKRARWARNVAGLADRLCCAVRPPGPSSGTLMN